MGRIVVSEFVTLDGVIEDPGGSEKSPYGGWAFKFDRGAEGDKFKFDELMSADALLLGRQTYEGFAAAWPGMSTDPFGQRMNGIPKYVVSSTLTDASWNNSTILRGDPVQEVTRLKESTGEILVAGSGRLVSALYSAGLIDEYRLMVFPIVVGGGKSLFDGVGMPVSLRLAEAVTAADTLLLRYVRS
jgi:dihydrofolate reductase